MALLITCAQSHLQGTADALAQSDVSTAEPGIAIQQRNSEASSGADRRRGIHTNASASMSAPVTRGVAVDPTALAPPFARYSHGCEVSFAAPNTRMVFVSGQLGVKPDGTCSEDAYTQATQCLKNVLAVLDGAGMGVANVVRLNAYVTHRDSGSVFHHHAASTRRVSRAKTPARDHRTRNSRAIR